MKQISEILLKRHPDAKNKTINCFPQASPIESEKDKPSSKKSPFQETEVVFKLKGDLLHKFFKKQFTK